MMAVLTEEELQVLYTWIDEIPLSRQKKNITRDFSDGVLAAEVVNYHLPKLVELHNYSPANSIQQKLDNWRTLNRKVFSKLNFHLPDDILQSVSASKQGVVEFILSNLRVKIERYLQNRTATMESEDTSMSPDDGFSYHPPMFAGGMYDPQQLVSNHGAEGIGAYIPQELARHPGPVQNGGHFVPGQGRTGGGAVQYPVPMQVHPSLHVSPQHQPSKIPQPQHGRLPALQHTQKGRNGPVSFPSNGRAGVGLGGGGGRSLSNSEKRKKYAGNPLRNPAPTGASKESGNSADVQLRMAEKDQRILESQEYIQLLQMKLTRLEHLVQIKEMKITELSRQIELMHRHNMYPQQRR